MGRFIALTLIISIFAGCDKPAKPEPGKPEVFVTAAEEKPYRPSQAFSAQIQSRSDVQISAQVSGKLIAIHFTEGDSVTAGTPLFDIDPAPFKAALDRAKAEKQKAQANVVNTTKNFERGKELVKEGFVSQSEFDGLEAKMLEAKAQLAAAEAAVESAKVDLGYTKITANQAGRLGRSIPAVGDIVGPQSGPLTTIVGQNDMDIVFQIPERLLLAAKRKDSKIKVKDIEVVVILEDDSEYDHTGKITYIANRVDGATGTIEARAQIPNPDDLLRAGMYAQALLRLEHPLQGLMVPQAAVQVDQQGTYVLTVNSDNIVERNNIITGERFGENVLINSGLNEDAKVIVRGVQKARPGTEVITSLFKPATKAHQGEAK